MINFNCNVISFTLLLNIMLMSSRIFLPFIFAIGDVIGSFKNANASFNTYMLRR